MNPILKSPTLDINRACKMIEEAAGKEAADNFRAIILLELPGRHYSSKVPNCNFVDANMWWEKTLQGYRYWEQVNRKMRLHFTNGEYTPERRDDDEERRR